MQYLRFSEERHLFAVLVLYLLEGPVKRPWGVPVSDFRRAVKRLHPVTSSSSLWCNLEVDAENKLNQEMCLGEYLRNRKKK